MLVGTSGVGGTERFVAGLLSRLGQHGIASAIGVVDDPGAFADEYRRAADEVWHLGWASSDVAHVLVRWQECLLAWQPEVLMLCGFRANMLGRLVSGGAPVVNALRSVVLDDIGRPLARWLDRVTFGRVALCVSNSQAAIDVHVAAGFPAERFQWIPNGVDLARFRAAGREAERRRLGVADDERIVITVGNLRPVKNHGLLLRASRRLHDRGVAHRVWIVGEGAERERLADQARALGLSGSVELLGAAPDLVARYASADVFALASHFEGMPTVVLEAFAAGLPVVATAVGDVPALCKDTGLVVPPDDEEAMVAALERMLLDHVFAQAQRTSALVTAEHFSIDEMTARYAAVLHRTAGRHDLR